MPARELADSAPVRDDGAVEAPFLPRHVVQHPAGRRLAVWGDPRGRDPLVDRQGRIAIRWSAVGANDARNEAGKDQGHKSGVVHERHTTPEDAQHSQVSDA